MDLILLALILAIAAVVLALLSIGYATEAIPNLIADLRHGRREKKRTR